MGNIKNTKPFHKLTRVWGSANSVRTADSYAEYLTAALARGDGRSPGSLANLVTCFMGGWISVPPQTVASIRPNSTHTHSHKHPSPLRTPAWFLFLHREPRSVNLISSNTISKHSSITICSFMYVGRVELSTPNANPVVHQLLSPASGFDGRLSLGPH